MQMLDVYRFGKEVSLLPLNHFFHLNVNHSQLPPLKIILETEL